MKLLVVANWKMNPKTLPDAKKLFSATKNIARLLKKTHVVVALPSVYAHLFKGNSRISLGGQDISPEKEGAHTGDISPLMLKAAGFTHVIVGHSERRTRGESNELISQKIKALLDTKITPIVCVGEKERDAHGNYLKELETQIIETCAGLKAADLKKIVIAYEPVWAIGEKATHAQTPQDTHETALFIRKVLADQFGKKAAFSVPLLYGGSVHAGNALLYVREAEMQGLLVGRASLDQKVFKELLHSVDRNG